MTFHDKDINTVITSLKSDANKGLSREEAKKRLNQYGENKLQTKKKTNIFIRFLKQFNDIMIIILLIAALVSFTIAIIEGESKEFFEPILIILIVILNAIMGVLQESKAEKALDSLRNMATLHARVVRDNDEDLIAAEELVPGDIIHVEAGDFIPADARIIESFNLKSEEAALTGESVPTDKNENFIADENSALGDRLNMLYSSCSVTYGSAKAVVTATGMNTEVGHIATLLTEDSTKKTPLQEKLAKLGKYLGILALIACLIIFIIGLINDLPPLELFMTAVSLAVSAIPEGLPAIVTIVLSIGVERMVKKNALIRHLPAVETLGSASIIASDKTGTLTENRMTLVKAYCERGNTLEDISDNNSSEIRKLLQFATLCCDGSVSIENNGVELIGDPTETAIIMAALKNGSSKDELEDIYPRITELPFDSDRKMMSTVNRIDRKLYVIVKGAFDVLINRLVTGNIELAKKINDEMSNDALRVIAIAYKEISTLPDTINSASLETDLNFMGLVGMIDPPRSEAKLAVATCKEAGITPIMITGDHIKTATAIARDLGILETDDIAITGVELDKMSDEELANVLPKIKVYARVSPENKSRIVKAWQEKNQVVAMTGDGVNDAPALKAADIGCAMGITGTDVAKNAADMTLLDDNFATIVDAVREGRGIYANIKKVVSFLLGTNIGEVVAVFLSMLFWHQSPLLSMQLLWINLATDSFPAIALGMESVDENIMKEKPTKKDESIFAHGLGARIIIQGLFFGILTLIAFRIGYNATLSVDGGRTMAFMVLGLSQIIQAFNLRSDHSLFKIGIFRNNKLNIAALISILLITIVLFTPLREIFQLIVLPTNCYIYGILLSLISIIIIEILKALGIIRHKKIETSN